ncbi:MAG: LamG-like jellyroll fold domain-containing protein [Candidatus Omnitrophota bacterium]|nr:LamG-like jellyroll fold domain-containing protein [Candidatus Omnitrophota bacterium]
MSAPRRQRHPIVGGVRSLKRLALLAVVCGLWTMDYGLSTAYAATEFVSTIKATGGDYTSLITWDARACDLTAATTKVFAHSGITGAIPDGSSVVGARSGATAIMVHATSTQILLKQIDGVFLSGERVQRGTTNYVTISDAGNSAIAVAETSLQETLASTLTLGAWKTSAANYVEIRAASSQRHKGVVGQGGAGVKFTGSTGSLLASGVGYLRLTNLYLESTGSSTSPLMSLTSGTSEARVSGCLLRKSSSATSGYVVSVASGALKLSSNILIDSHRNATDCQLYLTSSASGTSYLYGNTFYSSGNAADLLKNLSASSPLVVKSNVVFGFSSTPLNNTGGSALTDDYNAYTGTPSGRSGANDTTGLDASGHLTTLAVGGEDLHLLFASRLRGAGWPGMATDTNLPVTTDLDGDVRAGNDLGADFFVGGPPKAPTALTQLQAGGTTPIAIGGEITTNAATFTFSMSPSSAAPTLASATLIPQIEIKEVGGAFDGSLFDPDASGTLGTGLISYWQMDKTSGSGVVGDAKGSNDGTAVNGPTIVAGKLSNALSFNGTTQYVDLGNKTAWDFGTGGFTIAAWIKTSATTGQLIYFRQDDGNAHNPYVHFLVTGSGFLSVAVRGTEAVYHELTATTGAVNDGAWHHVVLRSTGSNGTLYAYRDGVEVASRALGATTVNYASAPASIGVYRQNWVGVTSTFFNGQIDEVGIWSRALSASEVANLYRAEWSLLEGSPVAYAGAAVTGTVTKTNFTFSAPAKTYHWRARVKDQTGQVSPWVAFGGNAETETDLMTLTGRTINANTTWADDQVFTNLLITNNAVVTVDSINKVGGAGQITAEVLGNLVVDSGASITANRTGYGSTSGPGQGGATYACARTGGGGAGYGGAGGAGYARGGGSYGSASQPIDMGSGGGHAHEPCQSTTGGGGSGGGALKLTVTGTLAVNGSVSANGGDLVGCNGQGGCGGGGSGGSLWFEAGTLAGTGSISANGGNGAGGGDGSGGGAGGRIVVYYTAKTFAGTLTAAGGTGRGAGGAGTISLELAHPPTSVGQFQADGVTAIPTGQATNNQMAVFKFSMTHEERSATLTPQIEVKEVGVPFNESGVLEGPAVAYAGAALTGTVTKTDIAYGQKAYHWRARVKDSKGNYSRWVAFGGNAETAADVTTLEGESLTGAVTWNADKTFTNLHITNGAVVTVDSFNKGGGAGQIVVNVIGDLTIDAGAAISADGRGYGPSSGPGAGCSAGCGSHRGGGGYGGVGSPGTCGGGGGTYGSSTQPTDMGSGGGGGCEGSGSSGAGSMKFVVGGTLTVNGTISAMGGNGVHWGGGGSGGSVWTEVGTLGGSGSISVNGGSSASGGGGGGRMALYYAAKTYTGTLSATGGAGFGPAGAGTIIESRISVAPMLLTPADKATHQRRKPTLTFKATDADGDYLRYKIVLAEDSAFSVGLQTFDQTASQVGWSGQDADGGKAYASGTTATYTLQTDLVRGKTYYWKAHAIDPAGSNVWSPVSVVRSFTVGPTLTITVPNGGEGLAVGQPTTITWTSQGPIPNVKLSYSLNNGADGYPHPIADSTPNDGTEAWTVPDVLSSQVKVKIVDVDDGTTNDVSDATLTIGQPTLKITSPNGGEAWSPSEIRPITWTSSGAIPYPLTLEYTKDGATFKTLATGEANDGMFDWTIPWDLSDTVKVKLSTAFARFFKDASSFDFGLGTLTNTELSGTGLSAKVQLAKDQEVSRLPSLGAWNFKEGSGATTVDLSGKGNTGTLTNGPTWTTGKLGNGLSFDGVDDYVDLQTLPIASGDAFTIAGWIKLSASQGDGRKFFSTLNVREGGVSSGATFGVGMGVINTGHDGINSNSLFLQTGKGHWSWSVSSSPTNSISQTNRWYHVAVTVSNATSTPPTVTFYIDGVKQTATPWGDGNAAISYGTDHNAARIGGSHTPGSPGYDTNYFNGLIDELAIYPKVLSVEEIAALYNGGTGITVGGGTVYVPSGTFTSRIFDTGGNTGFGTVAWTGTLLSADVGTVGSWHFDETTGTIAADKSGSSNTGTLTNGPTWTTGKVGNALQFDGTNDYVDLGNGASVQLGGTDKSFTLAAWAKRASSGTGDVIVLQGVGATNQGLTMMYRAANSFTCGFYGNDLDTSATYPDVNEWHHWVCTYDGATNARKIYRDGVLTASDTAASDYVGSGGTRIGMAPWDVSGYFGGLIDEVRIYNRVLTAGEVVAVYQTGSLPFLRARSSNDPAITGAPDFVTCPFLTSGQDLSGGCVKDGDRYLQYQVSMATSDLTVTPSLDDLTINYDSTTILSDLSDAAFAIKQPKLTFIQQPSGTATAGVAFAQQPKVAVQTLSGQTITTDQSTEVTLLLATGTGALTGTKTVKVVNGVAAFTGLSYNLSENIALNAVASPNAAAALSTPIAIGSATAKAISISGITDPIAAGDPSDVMVTIRDQFGNLATDYTGTIHFTSSDPKAALPPDFSFGTSGASAGWVQTSDADFSAGTLSNAAISGRGEAADVVLSLDAPVTFTEGFSMTTLRDSSTTAEWDEARGVVRLTPDYKADASLAGAWLFEEAGGVRADATGKGNTLGDINTVASSAENKEGERSAQLAAAGSEALVITVSALDAATSALRITGADQPIAVSAWVKPAGVGSPMGIVSLSKPEHRHWLLALDSANKVVFSLSENGTAERNAVGATALVPGTWYQVAGVYNDTEIRVYVNGLLDSSTSNPLAHTQGIFPWEADTDRPNFAIGHTGDPGAGFFNGLIDEVAVFSRALAPADVASVYEKGLASVVKYAPSAVAQSLTVDAIADSIASATLNATADLPAGSAISYFLSADGGKTWELATNLTTHTFAAPGSDLRWKAQLSTTNPSVTPTLKDVTISHATAYVSSGTLESSTKEVKADSFGTLSWTASAPAGTGVKFQLATNNDNLTWSYKGPDGTANSYYTTPGAPIHAGHNGQKFVRYKAFLAGAPANGLVSYWNMDEASGSTVADAVGANAGTATGTAVVAGKLGNARAMNGGSVSVANESNFDFSGPMTVAFWAYRTSSSSPQHLFGKRTGCTPAINYQMHWGTSSMGWGVGTSSSNLPLNTWTHIVGTFDGSTFRLYFNGVANASGAGSLGALNNDPLTIGTAGSCAPFGGQLDEVGIWNRALSAEEIATLYNGGTGLSAAAAVSTPVLSEVNLGYNTTAGAVGTHTFPKGVTLKAVGEQSVKVQDVVLSTLSSTQSGITVTPAAPTQLGFTQQPPSAMAAGSPFTVKAAVQDTLGNTVTSDNATAITLAVGKGTASLQGALTKTVVSGVATFGDLSYQKAETMAITASGGGYTSATSADVAVGPAAANKLAFTTVPAGDSVVVGARARYTVTAQDRFGNAQPAHGGLTVPLTSSSVSAGKAFYDAATGGTPITHLTLADGMARGDCWYLDEKVGAYAIATTHASLANASHSLNVTAAPAVRLAVSGETAAVTGVAATLTITAYDTYGNVAASYTGDKSVTFSGANSSPSPSAKNPACTDKAGSDVAFGTPMTMTFTNGAASCSMKLYKVETAAVKATSGSLATAETDALSVTVRHGPADHVMFKGSIPVPQPANKFEAGVPFVLGVLQAVDRYDNVADGGSGSALYSGDKIVTYALSGTADSPDGSTADAYTNSVSFLNGLSTTLLTTMLYRAQATSVIPHATDLTGADVASNAIKVVAGPVAKLSFYQQPSTTSLTNVALAQQPKVAVADQYGNPSTSASDQITLTASLTNGTFTPVTNGALTGDALTVTTTNGLAAFSGINYSYPEPIYLRASSSSKVAPDVYSFRITLSTGVEGALTSGALAEPATLSSTAYSAESRVAVFDVKVTDTGVDGYPIKIKQLAITRGTTADTTGGWLNVIGGASLSDGSTTMLGAVTADALAFGSGTSTVFTVANGTSKTYTLTLYLKPLLPAGIDGKKLAFDIDPNDDLMVDPVGSSFPAADALISSLTVDVTATKFVVLGIGATAAAGVPMAITVSATDVNGNLDTQYAGPKELVFSGANPSTSGQKPTCTNFAGVPMEFGQVTLVDFLNGRNTSAVSMTLYKAEGVAVKAATSDVMIATSSQDDLELIVTGGTPAKLSWHTQPEPVAVASAPWRLFKVSVADAYGNATPGAATVKMMPSVGCTTKLGSADTVPTESGVATFNNFAVTCAAYPAILTVNATGAGLTETGASSTVTVAEKFAITAKAIDSVNGGALTEVTLKIMDAATGQPVTGLTNPMTGNSPFIFSLPFGTYDFNFTKEAYVETTVQKLADVAADVVDGAYDANVIWTVFVTSVAESLADYRVLSNFVYDEPVDRVNASVRLEKRGRQVLSDPINTLKSCTLQVFDSSDAATPIYETSLPQPDANGNYWFKIDKAVASTKFVSGRTYFAKLAVRYGGPILETNVAYTAVTTFDIGISARLKILTDEIKSEVAGVQTTVASEAEATRSLMEFRVMAESQATQAKISTESALTKAKIAAESQATQAKVAAESQTTQAKVADVKADAQKILTATDTTLPSKIEETRKDVEAARQEVETARKSEILNRESTVKLGETLMIRYRTYPGLAPILDLYDGRNVPRINMAPMTEIGQSGIYEYAVAFLNTWGRGDFTIVCSESTKGTMDAAIITALSSSIEEVAGQVSAVMGSTSEIGAVKAGVMDLRALTGEVNSQFSVLESALAKISGDMAGKLEAVAASANELTSVHGQLSKMADVIKDLTGQTGMNLEKLYQVSKDKKEDIVYLKNKAQQLKAAMEMNQKMVDNIANKPITQTWFEFR